MHNQKEERRIGVEINIVSNLLRREIDRNHRKNSPSEDSTISGVRWWLIAYLATNQQQDIFQKDIEKQFSLRRSTVSKGLTLMEQKGFIQRVPVTYDKRLKKIILTPKALALYEEGAKYSTKIEEQFRSVLSEQEIDQFFQIMEKLKYALNP